MNFSIGVTCAVVVSVLLAGCVVYPTSRTFYEPTSGEGTLRNQTSCGFLHTRDTVERNVNGVRVAVMVGSERESADRQPDLYVTLTIEGPFGSWDIKTSQVLLVPEGSNVGLAPDLATDSGNSHFTRWTLHFADPAGKAERLEIRFGVGALTIRGAAVELAPLHFRRVKKSDAYMGSINC